MEKKKRTIEIPPYLRDTVDEMDVRTVLDVPYLHLRTKNGDDMFFTEAGVPFVKQLAPSNFFRDREWFTANRSTLDGSSLPYRVGTKEIDGTALDVVFKWNRMGVNPLIPDSTHQFNSPFEEFALVLELQRAGGRPIHTQEPLAIFVPSDRATLESLQRRSYLMERIMESHHEADMDMHREYAVIYKWVPGESFLEKVAKGWIEQGEAERWAERVRDDLEERGFAVADHKMCHVILNSPDSTVPLDANGDLVYRLVDFELLYRTPNHEKSRRAVRREQYYSRQSTSCLVHPDFAGHEELHPVNILGVEYICGEVSSTGGYLWVAGRDPNLFEYYLPEKWRNTSKDPITLGERMYRTRTDDDIDLIWKVSRVGEKPIVEPSFFGVPEMYKNGYNSPFEEFSFALELGSLGMDTITPRAIYMSGQNTDIREYLCDGTRFASHSPFLTPEGRPVLRKDHEYVTIWENCAWGDDTASADGSLGLDAIDALQAYFQSLINEQEYFTLIRYLSFRLAKLGYRDLNLRGCNVLLFLNDRREVYTDEQGIPLVRYCNFEFLERSATIPYASSRYPVPRYA